MMRDPRGGRNFEYVGEDPFLTAEMGVAYIRGVQAWGNRCDRQALRGQ